MFYFRLNFPVISRIISENNIYLGQLVSQAILHYYNCGKSDLLRLSLQILHTPLGSKQMKHINSAPTTQRKQLDTDMC